ncbi:hypothetical protein NOR_03488 [Metarhizium rileyi]|uniref:Uncharacterized protein n=1 Tax=Metarhizium rileyi (strain RCEF 4871) TaxID=1649241 RepID=A0A167FSQ7_METRR|nr:hypothetical protein NOR_03488 [Metarhizium rileyi RCEF 4871]
MNHDPWSSQLSALKAAGHVGEPNRPPIEPPCDFLPLPNGPQSMPCFAGRSQCRLPAQGRETHDEAPISSSPEDSISTPLVRK